MVLTNRVEQSSNVMLTNHRQELLFTVSKGETKDVRERLVLENQFTANMSATTTATTMDG